MIAIVCAILWSIGMISLAMSMCTKSKIQKILIRVSFVGMMPQSIYTLLRQVKKACISPSISIAIEIFLTVAVIAMLTILLIYSFHGCFDKDSEDKSDEE